MREDDEVAALILPIYFIAMDSALAICNIGVINSSRLEL